MNQKTFTVALMDAPYESDNLTTAFRILDALARRGHNITVSLLSGFGVVRLGPGRGAKKAWCAGASGDS